VGQESETQKRGDKTTFICPETGAACQISVPCRVRYSGVSVAPRSEISVLVRMFWWGREVVEESRTKFWRVLWQPGGAFPELGLASSLDGAVPGDDAELVVQTSTVSGEDPETIWRRWNVI
jgi:hypothetical protein